MRSLKLGNLLKIDDEGLVALCKLSTLTILDVTWSIGFCFGSYMPRNITDMGMYSLGSEWLKGNLIGKSFKISQIWGYNVWDP